MKILLCLVSVCQIFEEGLNFKEQWNFLRTAEVGADNKIPFLDTLSHVITIISPLIYSVKTLLQVFIMILVAYSACLQS